MRFNKQHKNTCINKIKRILIYVSLTIIIFLPSCNNQVDSAQINIPFEDTLIPKQIGKNNLYIFIPPNYKIEKTQGHDFDVFYFAPIDITIKAGFTGGLYFGHHPNKFEPNNEECNTKFIKSDFFDKQQNWEIYDCNGEFSIQTIVDNKNKGIWGEKMHVFGHATNEIELNKLIEIYTRLRIITN